MGFFSHLCECLCLCGSCTCAVTLIVMGLYFASGIILIALASSAKTSIATYQDLITDDLSLFPNLCIAIGVLFTFLLIFGYTERKCGMKSRIVYILAQSAVLAIQLYIVCAAYPDETKVRTHVTQGLNSTLHSYYWKKLNATKVNQWDTMQEDLQCCGVFNYLDWQNNLDENLPTPISCCREEFRMRGCSNGVNFDHPADSARLINVQGCLKPIQSQLLDKMGVLFYILYPITAVVLFGFIESCCSLRKRKAETLELEEKKVGPLIIRRKSKKIKDVETPEVNDGEVKEDQEPTEIEKLNPETNGESHKTIETS